MEIHEKLEARKEARRLVQEFFEPKRKKLAALPDRTIGSRMLAELNGIARDAEHRAMDLAENGKGWGEARGRAEKELDKLKKDYEELLGGNDPVASAPNKKLIEAILQV